MALVMGVSSAAASSVRLMPTAPMQSAQLTMDGRTAGSLDTGSSFFMINDSGTYFIKKLPSLAAQTALTPQAVIDRAHLAKVKY